MRSVIRGDPGPPGGRLSALGITKADGVFEGGGVKGVALIGALLRFYDEGCTEWVNVAGTSAGAIIASYLACGHSAKDAEALMRSVPFASFEDWGPAGPIFGGGFDLAFHRGLCRGEEFRAWMDDQLQGATFKTLSDRGRTLKLIAADISNREMVVLPDALSRYRRRGERAPIDPFAFPIAEAVRMSMSIPYFFQPVELIRDDSGQPATIVDGGVLSNFPVWLFDAVDRDPLRPTFGFKLTGGKGVGGGVDKLIQHLGWPVQMGVDIFHTATDAWDKEFEAISTRVRTVAVSALDVGTTDFQLSPAKQQALIDSGEKAAGDFLAQFNRGQYLNSHGRSLGPASPASPGPPTVPSGGG